MSNVRLRSSGPVENDRMTMPNDQLNPLASIEEGGAAVPGDGPSRFEELPSYDSDETGEDYQESQTHQQAGDASQGSGQQSHQSYGVPSVSSQSFSHSSRHPASVSAHHTHDHDAYLGRADPYAYATGNLRPSDRQSYSRTPAYVPPYGPYSTGATPAPFVRPHGVQHMGAGGGGGGGSSSGGSHNSGNRGFDGRGGGFGGGRGHFPEPGGPNRGGNAPFGGPSGGRGAPAPPGDPYGGYPLHPAPVDPWAPNIMGGRIIGRTPPDFLGKERSHIKSHSWMLKHQDTAQLNRHLITPENKVLWHGQYLLETAARWFQTVPAKLKAPCATWAESYANWDEFIRLFLLRFDDPNWLNTALESYNTIRQEGEYKDIHAYCDAFTVLYDDVKGEVSLYAVLRRFMDGLRSQTKADCQRQMTTTKQLGVEMSLDELMASAQEFEANYLSNRRRGTGNAAAGNQNANAHANLNVMRGGARGRGQGGRGGRGGRGRGGAAGQPATRKCYNCGSPDHLSNKCDKPHVPGHAPPGWVPKTTPSSGNA